MHDRRAGVGQTQVGGVHRLRSGRGGGVLEQAGPQREQPVDHISQPERRDEHDDDDGE
jgi:hypothetical protein